MDDSTTYVDLDNIPVKDPPSVGEITIPEKDYKTGRLHGFFWGIGTSAAALFILRRWL